MTDKQLLWLVQGLAFLLGLVLGGWTVYVLMSQ
jgi:hypothetical protein